MKVLLLAGGFGTRFSEMTDLKPKPMIEIGPRPILWHIMKLYSQYGHKEFVILLGYKGHVIKEYFINYFMQNADIEVNTATNEVSILNNKSEDWKITLLETGLNTMTGGRIARAKEIIGNEPFMLTYGDGVSNVNIDELLTFHKEHGGAVTMTTVQPDGRFGGVEFDEEGIVESFVEKPVGDGKWINAGCFVCEPRALDYIKEGDSTIWEREPLEALAANEQLFAYRHTGFWKPMDTLKDNTELNEMWASNEAPWKVW